MLNLSFFLGVMASHNTSIGERVVGDLVSWRSPPPRYPQTPFRSPFPQQVRGSAFTTLTRLRRRGVSDGNFCKSSQNFYKGIRVLSPTLIIIYITSSGVYKFSFVPLRSCRYNRTTTQGRQYFQKGI